MNEAEFDRRLMLLIQDANNQPGVEGIADFLGGVFGAVKNVVTKVGGGLLSGIKTLGVNTVKFVGKVATGAASIVGSGAAKTLVDTAGVVYVAKKGLELQERELALQTALADQQQTQLQLAMAAQGVNVTTPGARQLISDVVRNGIVDSRGQFIYPDIASQMNTAGASFAGIPMSTLLTFVALAFASAIVLPKLTGRK